jgi:cytochrome c-type biogenesis protein CcmF
MIPEIGHFALMLSLVVAFLAQSVLPMVGSFNGQTRWVALARPASVVHFVLVLIAYLALTAAFVNNDFSVQLVAENSNTALPTPLRIAATWGNHEGSILLWTLTLAAWTVCW